MSSFPNRRNVSANIYAVNSCLWTKNFTDAGNLLNMRYCFVNFLLQRGQYTYHLSIEISISFTCVSNSSIVPDGRLELCFVHKLVTVW